MNYILGYKLYENYYTCDPEICIRRNQIEELEHWLKRWQDPDIVPYSQTLLSIASKKRNSEIVELLLKYGADPDKQNKRGYTPLIYSTIENGIDIVRILISAGASLDLKTTPKHYTALMYAASQHRYKILNLLIESNANWSILDNRGKSFLDKLNKNQREKIIKRYPKKYEQFIKIKQSNKFNI